MIDTIKKDGDVAPVNESGTAEPAADKATIPAAGKEDAPRDKKGKPGLKGPWMYIGPTVPGIGIQNRVYTEIPADAAGRAKEVPEVGLLFIPIKDYPMANRMLRERTGYIYNAYCKAVQIRKGGDGA